MSDKKTNDKRTPRTWIPFLVVMLVMVLIAGAVLMRGGEGDLAGEGRGVLTASTGWGTTHFSNLSTTDLEVTDDLTVGDDCTITGDLTVTTLITSYTSMDATGYITTAVSFYGPDLTLTDDLIVGDDSTLTGDLDVSGATTLNSTLDVDGNITSGTGFITVTDSVFIDGQADAIQLTVQGYTTQTANILVAEDSAGTDQFTVSITGTTVAGTTDLVGNVSSSTGSITMTDSVNVTGAVDLDSTLNVDTTSALVGDVTASADVSTGLFAKLAEQTFISVTAGGTITATGTYQPIQSGSAVTTSLTIAIADGETVGQILILVNENAADVIIIDNGANTHLSANISLGNDDTLWLIWDGADWLELGHVDNT